jgi:hypothetical protein
LVDTLGEMPIKASLLGEIVMKKLIASLIVSTPLLLGSSSLFSSETANYPLYPINPVSTVNDKAVSGTQYAYYYNRGYHRGYYRGYHHGYYRVYHRNCWIGRDGFRHCRRW